VNYNNVQRYYIITLLLSALPVSTMSAPGTPDSAAAPGYTVHFGSAGASDYTQHRDPVRKQQYLARHAPREDWDNPMTAGALSRWVLWNKETLDNSIVDYIQRFDIALV
jgi:hypothetical protein